MGEDKRKESILQQILHRFYSSSSPFHPSHLILAIATIPKHTSKPIFSVKRVFKQQHTGKAETWRCGYKYSFDKVLSCLFSSCSIAYFSSSSISPSHGLAHSLHCSPPCTWAIASLESDWLIPLTQRVRTAGCSPGLFCVCVDW